MPFGGGRPRRLIPIKNSRGVTEFRWVSVDAKTPPKPHGTKWASCEIKGGKSEPKEPDLGIVGITSAGQPTYGAVMAQMMSFTSPCPLGTPPKPPKPNKSDQVSPKPAIRRNTIKRQTAI